MLGLGNMECVCRPTEKHFQFPPNKQDFFPWASKFPASTHYLRIKFPLCFPLDQFACTNRCTALGVLNRRYAYGSCMFLPCYNSGHLAFSLLALSLLALPPPFPSPPFHLLQSRWRTLGSTIAFPNNILLRKPLNVIASLS